MPCVLCKFLCDRFCPQEVKPGEIWRLSHKWEEDQSNEWELWDAQSAEMKQACETAIALAASDAIASTEMLVSLADRGSSFAARRAGWLYENGSGVETSLGKAELYYTKAHNRGSSLAALDLARVLRRKTSTGKWESILDGAVQAGFAPASFWLGWYRYEGDRKNSVAREVAPLIESAALAGHPGARLTLALWMSRGYLGWLRILAGFKAFAALYRDAKSGRLGPDGGEDQNTAEVDGPLEALT